MRELVEYIVKPLVAHPDDVSVAEIDGSASVLLELRLNPADHDVLRGDGNRQLRAIQQVLSAAGGDRKPVLDLVENEEAADLADEE